MTKESTRATTAPKEMRVDKTNPTRARLCATCEHEHAPDNVYPCNCCWNPLGDMYRRRVVPIAPAVQPSPSIGGEPATNSTGLWHAPGMGEVHSHDHMHMIECLRETGEPDEQNQVMDDDLAKKVCAALNAAREPAPVARKLDADAERLREELDLANEHLRQAVENIAKLTATRATAESAPASAAPREQWISVEDERKPVGRTPILVAVSFVRFGEYEDGTPGEWPGQIVAEGEYVPQHGEAGGYFTCYSSPHGDLEGITHWMPLPAAPSNSSPAGAKESK